MLNRRSFLAALAAMPFLGWLKPGKAYRRPRLTVMRPRSGIVSPPVSGDASLEGREEAIEWYTEAEITSFDNALRRNRCRYTNTAARPAVR